MARQLSRRVQREGRGFGERLTEFVVYILIIGAVAYGVNWYIKVYLPSPSNILSKYLGAVRDGRAENQFPYLAKSTTSRFNGSAQKFDNEWPEAHGLAARISDYTITNIVTNGDTTEADVTLNIRRSGQEIYQASSDKFQDHYVLVRESDGWKVALDDPRTKLDSLKAVSSR